MGDSTPTVSSNARDILGALERYAPGAIAAISKSLGSTAGGQLSAEQSVAPGYQDLYRGNQLASAQTEADIVGGPAGQSLVSSADKYQQQLDPEYYKQRGTVSAALDKYLGGYDPSRLSPTEEAQIARGIGATGGNLLPSAANTIRNAQVFGDAGTDRWKNFGDMITKAAGAIPALKSGLVGFDIAKTRGDDTGARDATNNALNANFGFSTSALGDISGISNQLIAKKKDAWDKAWGTTNSVANLVGAVRGGG